jgi:hypothetical protein
MWWRQIAECGFLCGWEVLLGAGGNGGESAGILEDAASAVRLMRRVQIRLVRELPARGGIVPASTGGVHVWRIDGNGGGGGGVTTVVDVCLADREGGGWSWRWLPKRLRDGARIEVLSTLFAHTMLPPPPVGSRANGNGSGALNSPDSLVGLTRHAEEINDECLHLLHVYFQVRPSARAGAAADVSPASLARSLTSSLLRSLAACLEPERTRRGGDDDGVAREARRRRG